MPDDAPWTDPVVVPDDIRALQPDIEAYHRELRQAARRRRLGPLAAVLRWRHLAVPLGVTTGALLVAALVTVVLTFGGSHAATRPPVAAPLATSSAATAGTGGVGGLLPAIDVRTESGRTVPMQSLRPALVALVPQHCGCTPLLASLAGQAGEVRVKLVVVAPSAADAEVAALPGQLRTDQVLPVWDAGAMLASTYDASGVTVLVVAPDATVTYIGRDVVAGAHFDLQLLSLLPHPPTAAARIG